MASRTATALAGLLAVLLLGFGLYEVYQHRDTSIRTQVLWGVALIGSGCLVAVGALVRRHHGDVGTAMLVIGCVAAVIPTLWTLLLPILELGVIALALRDHARAARFA